MTALERNRKTRELAAAVREIWRGAAMWRIWSSMAAWDIRRRYRRTGLGPIWATLSHGIYIGALGALFSVLWNQDTSFFLPYFASGFLTWVLLSTLVSESCTVFVAVEPLLKQSALPYTVFVCSLISRNLIVMAHHLVVYLVVVIVFSVPVGFVTLLFVPGLAVLLFAVSWLAILIGMACARYRDIQQVVASALQLSMFVTPIFWAPESLPASLRPWLVEPNVLYHVIMLVRMPLIGEVPELKHWLVGVGVGIVGWGMTIYFFAKFRQKLIFWL
jgi:lipopolysaccharide transport system permease protein